MSIMPGNPYPKKHLTSLGPGSRIYSFAGKGSQQMPHTAGVMSGKGGSTVNDSGMGPPAPPAAPNNYAKAQAGPAGNLPPTSSATKIQAF